MFDVHRDAPLPADYETALDEILALRVILAREREQLAKKVVQRELDKRSAKGTIEKLIAEIKMLRAKHGEEPWQPDW